MYHQASRILQQPRDNPDYPTILLTSPTETASYNIGGITLHAALHLPQGKYYSLRSNPSLFSTFQLTMSQLKILVIDEISMVGRSMLAHIHRRLQEAKGVENTDLVFGGVSILAVGDFYQLPPVRQQKIFDYDITNPDNMDPEELAVVLAGLWVKNFTMVELTEVMRQREDLCFAEMLNRLRTASHTDQDISILHSKVATPVDSNFPQDALHIFATRKDVDQHNETMLAQQSEEKFEIRSITKVPKVVKSFDVNQPVAGLPNIITLCVHARVMIIKNLDVADGLVNGATGKILDIIFSAQSSTFPKAVIVQFDNNKIGKIARQSSKLSLSNYIGGVPILPVELKQHAGRTESSPEITRIQYPLVLFWACTIHKVQGATLDKVVISFNKIQTKGQAYVAVSRVTSLQGLFFLDFKPQVIKVDEMVSKEMARLRDHCTPELQNYSTIPKNVLRFCFFNVQSLQSTHQKDVNNDPYLLTASVLALSETWQKYAPRLPAYDSVVGIGRQTEHGGGVALYTKVGILLEDIKLPHYNTIDAVAALITTAGKTLTTLLMYCPPRALVTEIYSCMKDFLDRFRGHTMIIGGDVNINLDTLTRGKAVLRMSQEENLHQVSSGPTHHSGSHIDHVWTNLLPLPNCFGLWTYYSDHKQIFIDIDLL